MLRRCEYADVFAAAGLAVVVIGSIGAASMATAGVVNAAIAVYRLAVAG